MKSNLEKVEGLKRELSIEVPKTLVTEAFVEAYEDIQKKVEVKGFRKGKAPMSTIQKLYKDRVQDDVINKLVSKSYMEALKEHDIEPITQPEIQLKNFSDDQDFTYTAKVEVKPEVKITKLEGLEVEVEKLNISDDKINTFIEDMRKNFKEEAPVLEDRPAQMGDLTVIDFKGTMDDKPLEGGSLDGHSLELGSGQFIPGFEDSIVGMKTNDNKVININFPDDYFKADLAGKPVTFDVALKEIKKVSLPEVNDELAQKISPEYKTLAELKTKIKESFEKSEKQRIDGDTKVNILKAFARSNKFDVPEGLIKEQIHKLQHRAEHQLKSQNMTDEQIAEYHVKWSNHYKEEADFGIRVSFLLEAASEKLGITVNDSDIKEAIAKKSSEHQFDPKAVEDYYSQPEQRNMLAYEIKEQKLVDEILKTAKIKEVEKAKA